MGAFAGNLEGTTPGAGVAGIIDDAYYTGNDVLNGLGGGTLQNADITKGTEAQFQDPGFFTTFNFSGVWSIDPDINSGFPFLTDNSPVDGIGGEADTYFSIANSDWSSAATWSTEGCGGSEASDPPPSNVAVVICNGTTVSVSDDVSNSVSVLVQDIATLSVENEGRLTISSGGFLTVESSSTFGVLTGGIAEIEGGATIENDGSIVIASGGYFYNISASNPEITMLRVLGGDAGWRYLSAPVSVTLESFLAPIWTQGVTGGNTTFGRTNIFEWPINQSGRERTEWDEITNLTTETVTAGKGYLVYVYESDLDGSNSGPKTLSVTGTEFSTTSTVITNITVDGWTLLGNPFATSVDFTEFRDTQTSGTITDAVYVWDPASDSDKPQEDFVVGDWKSFSDGTGDLTDGLISPFQAFFVQNAGTSTGVNLAFNNNVKSSMPGNTVEMFKETEQKRVRLELAGEGFKTSVWVRFSGAGSHSEFVDGDAWQLASMSAEYAVLAVQKTDRSLFDIGHFTPDDGQRIPLIAEATRRGEYTIRVTNIEGFDHSRIFLKDRDYNETIQLREGTEYRFQIDTVTEKAPADPFAILEQPIQKFSKEGITRFEIVLNSEEGFSHENPAEVSLKQNYPNPFNPTTQIRYELPQQENVRLTVYDMAGRQVAMLVNQSMNAGAHTVTFDASNLSSGVYVYRLQAGSTVLSRKLTVIK
ncbi:MAG: T9SS C-terminal target domain-containing protein [Balneolaceae bacterium]|nr:MAG: T9SS C-terminal target domain-containing protein [Balneolaceae bacterium]